jgi:Tol biopolymer transport system component
LKQITHGISDIASACTADGKWIVYNSLTDKGLWRTLKIRAEGGADPIELSPGTINFFPPSVSPDGKSVAQFRLDGWGIGAKTQIQILELETGKKIRVIPFDDFFISIHADFPRARWTPDGRNLTYVRCLDIEHCQLFMQPLSGAKPVQLTHFDSEPLKIADYAWSRDGKKFAITRQRARDTDVVMFSNFR